CISRLATKAFQWVTEPQPVHVCRLTPARPKAGGRSVAADCPSGLKALPSINSSASNLPGPQLRRTLRTGGWSGARRSATGRRAGGRRWVGSGGDDGTAVEVAVGPAVEPPADAGGQGVVHRGVAQRALDPDGAQAAAVGARKAGQAHDRVELQQRERGRRVV